MKERDEKVSCKTKFTMFRENRKETGFKNEPFNCAFSVMFEIRISFGVYSLSNKKLQ